MAKKLTDATIIAQLPQARRRAARLQRTEPHAVMAWYVHRSGALHLALINGACVTVPVPLIPALRQLPSKVLAQVSVGPAGVALRWEALDLDLEVKEVVRSAIGTALLLRAAGAAGGSARSAAKSRAARANGRKGGRPRTRGLEPAKKAHS